MLCTWFQRQRVSAPDSISPFPLESGAASEQSPSRPPGLQASRPRTPRPPLLTIPFSLDHLQVSQTPQGASTRRLPSLSCKLPWSQSACSKTGLRGRPQREGDSCSLRPWAGRVALTKAQAGFREEASCELTVLAVKERRTAWLCGRRGSSALPGLPWGCRRAAASYTKSGGLAAVSPFHASRREQAERTSTHSASQDTGCSREDAQARRGLANSSPTQQ